MIVQKGGQVTKPIIVVKVPCKLLYVIQVKEFLIKCLTSWPYLISEFLVAYITIVASDWPRTFFTPKVFLFSICIMLHLNFVLLIHNTHMKCTYIIIKLYLTCEFVIYQYYYQLYQLDTGGHTQKAKPVGIMTS